MQRGLVVILLSSLLLLGLEIYQATAVVPALRPSQARIARSFDIVATAFRSCRRCRTQKPASAAS